MAARGSLPSIVEYFYEPKGPSGHRCGYCSSEDGFVSNGMWAHRLTCKDYKNLIDRGWRRSGKYCYKPQNDKMCCPLYAISCDATNFALSKSQKKTLIKFKKYLHTGSIRDPPKESEAVKLVSPSRKEKKRSVKKPIGNTAVDKEEYVDKNVTSMSTGEPMEKTSENPVTLPSETKSDAPLNTYSEVSHEMPPSAPTEVSPETLVTPTTSNVPSETLAGHTTPTVPPETLATPTTCNVAPETLATPTTSNVPSETLAGHTTPTVPPETLATPTTCNVPPETLATPTTVNVPPETLQDIPDTVSGAQLELSSKNRSKSVPKKKKPVVQQAKKILADFIVADCPMIGQAHRLDVNLVRSSPRSPEFDRTFEESFVIYKKYQMAIHHDEESECDKKQFTNFLVDSPLIPCSSEGAGPEYGSYHCHYYIDGKLFMVGVLDLLPQCLSSVYLYYDPDFGFLSPGVFSALYEIAYTNHLSKLIQGLDQYYMGYYVHSCHKMRYKGNYFPSFLLCPETYRWQPIERCVAKLDKAKYSRLEEEAEHGMQSVESYIHQTLLLFEQQVIPYHLFKALFNKVMQSEITEYASLVGRDVATSMLLYVDQSKLVE